MGDLRGVGDPLKIDPHKAMLKKSKRLGKKLLGGKKKTFKEKTEKLEGYEAAGAMFSPDAWAPD